MQPIKLGEEAPVEIKVMPEEFYFKKVKIKSPEEEGGGPGSKSKTIWIILVAVLVIGLMAGAAYLFTQSLKKESQKPAEKPEANVNANVVINEPVNVPPANENIPVNNTPVPLCGNGICETGEDSASCSADCPPPPPPPTPAELTLATDTDKDGLSDTEEALYTTDYAKSDTDSDGYQDGLELVNLYNPTGFAPEKIEETALVKIYSNPAFKYSIFYPTSWLPRSLDESNRETMFTSTTGEFIQVIVEDNAGRLPLLDWYLAEVPGTSPVEVGTAATKGGLLGVKSPDGLTVYFASDDKIYAISYNIGVKTELNYKSTFEMIMKSFKLGM